MERLTKTDLLACIHADRRRFEAIVARVPRDRLVKPELPGGWSVKDVLAHIAWGEREATGVARARALLGSELWEVSEDERNAAVVEESRSRSLEQVLGEYAAAFDAYLAAVDELSEEDLNEPERISGLAERIPGWRPWRVLYDPTHYDEHGRAIEVHAIAEPPRGPGGDPMVLTERANQGHSPARGPA